MTAYTALAWRRAIKWSFSQPGTTESLSRCPNFGTLGKSGLNVRVDLAEVERHQTDVDAAGVSSDYGVQHLRLRLARPDPDAVQPRYRRSLGSHPHVFVLPTTRHHRLLDGQRLFSTRQYQRATRGYRRRRTYGQTGGQRRNRLL